MRHPGGQKTDAGQPLATNDLSRPFADLAVGLMKGCFAHFDEQVSIEREDLAAAEGSRVRFVMRKAA